MSSEKWRQLAIRDPFQLVSFRFVSMIGKTLSKFVSRLVAKLAKKLTLTFARLAWCVDEMTSQMELNRVESSRVESSSAVLCGRRKHLLIHLAEGERVSE